MANCFIGMQPINMQKVNGGVSEVICCFIKSASQQTTPMIMKHLLVITDAIKNFFTILSGLIVSTPGIDCIDEAFRRLPLGSFAKSKGSAPPSGVTQEVL